MKVLFFSPHAGLVEHSVPERTLVESLNLSGHDVVTVGCSGYLSRFCAVMSARRLTPDSDARTRKSVCGHCVSTAALMYPPRASVGHWQVEQFLPIAAGEIADEIVDNLPPHEWLDVEFLDMPIGRYAAYEFMLAHKLSSLEIPLKLWGHFKVALRNVMITAQAVGPILDFVQPDRVVLYNTLYGINRVWQAVSEGRGIPAYSIHAGHDPAGRLNTMMMYRDDQEQILIAQSPQAVRALETPLAPDQVRAVAASQSAQLRATNIFVYSSPHARLSPETVRNRLALSAERPVILVPLASADERFAAAVLGIEAMHRAPRVFANQNEWLTAILEFARLRTDLQFVVRVHPRMLANRREAIIAPAVEGLFDLLSTAPTNVKLNTPEQQLSITDIMQVVSLGLSGTSTAGLELLSWGIPVVVHDRELLFAYPSEIARSVDDRSDYYAAIDDALIDGWSVQHIIGAFRWLHFLHSVVARPVPWNASGRSLEVQPPSDGSSVRDWIHKTLRRSAPTSVRRRAQFVLNERLTAAMMRHVADHPPSMPAFETVLTGALPGLHYFTNDRLPTWAHEEERAIRDALGQLLNELGRFPDDPACLSSRIQFYLESGG